MKVKHNITTPSSEFEADSKEGIINIILKKPDSDGWLGAVQFSSTQLTYNNQSLTGNWEYQKNKFTLYGYLPGNDLGGEADCGI